MPCLVLFTAYQEWAKPRRYNPGDAGSFGKAVHANIEHVTTTANVRRYEVGGERRRGRFHIGVSLCAHGDDCPHTIDDGLVVALPTWGNALRWILAA